MFILAEQYTDLATIGQLSTITGGEIYYHPNYDPNNDGEKIHY